MTIPQAEREAMRKVAEAALASSSWFSPPRVLEVEPDTITRLLDALDAERKAGIEIGLRAAAGECDKESARRAQRAREEWRYDDASSACHTEASECADVLAERIRALTPAALAEAAAKAKEPQP